MKELWKTGHHKHVRGSTISAEAIVRLCCGMLLPLVRARVHRRGRRVSIYAAVSVSATSSCARRD